MLTIPQILPVKRMAIYGSTAMLVGFTSTLVMLRQFAPKDSSSGVAVVETINKKPTSVAANRLETKRTDNTPTVAVATLADQGALVVRSGSLPAQQYAPSSVVEPTNTAAVSSESAVATPTPVAADPATPTTEDSDGVVVRPDPVLPSTGDAPILQDAVTDVIDDVDINKVTLP